ncbi:hypothetical protein C0992_009471 [Termitomyces sp. T32_za158]|nr:hypothetical protein C0992_009471 [Termitomyces sp. T32_za158]
MLNVWKRSWKENEFSLNAQQKTMDGPSNSVSSMDPTVAAHPSNVGRVKAAHAEDAGHKRRYPDAIELDNPPRKKFRTDIPLNVNAKLLARVRQENAPSLSVGKHGRSDERGAKPQECLLRNDVVVFTPELLYEYLKCGELAMIQLHMLIFADMSELRGQILVSIQMVMKNFYMATDQSSRPRVLGFLPCLAQNVPPEISHMKSIMDSQLLHLDDYPFNKPSTYASELVIFYERTPLAVTSSLTEELSSLESADGFVQKYYNDSRFVLDEVGTCASDLFWRRAIREFNETSSCEIRAESDLVPIQRPIQDCIRDWTFTLPNLDPASPKFNVTHKFLMLVKALRSCGPYGEVFRGIILVKKRVVALAIRDMLRVLDDTPLFFRPLLVTLDTPHPASEHADISHLFRKGIYNVLIMMELNRDINTTEASVVVCFDDGFITFGKGIGQENPGGNEHLFNEMLNPSAIDIVPSTFLQDPTTGSDLYPKDAERAVDRIVSVGQLNGVTIARVVSTFAEVATGSEGGFTCTVTLPGLVQLTGPPRKFESDARSAACFTLCQQLYFIGLLDCSFFPQPVLPIDAFNVEGSSSKDVKSMGTRRYLRKEPDFWLNTKNSMTTVLYPLIISTTPPDNDVQPYTPLVMLTRRPLPDLPSFKVFHSGFPTVVSTKRCMPLQIKKTQLHDLHLYTLRMCRTLFNKPFECPLSDMSYFFATLTDAWSSEQDDPASPFKLSSISDYIHWDLVRLAGRSFSIPIKIDDGEELERDICNMVVQDRAVEFTRRYIVVRLRRDLSPLSKPLDSSREAAFENILEFTKARQKGFEDLQDVNQPLIEVTTIPAVLNQLNPTSRPVAQLKSPVKCDAFLKFISSTYLFVSCPTHKEGSLHTARQDLISNKSLFQHACRAGIPSYIQSKLFAPRLWTPPFFTPLSPASREDEGEIVERSAPSQAQDDNNIIEGNTKKKRKKKKKRCPDEHSQWLGDKAVADVAEAILAAGYLTGGRETALQVTKALGIPILNIHTWSDFAKKPMQASFNLSLDEHSIDRVETIIGYKVKQPQFLSQALSHSSVPGHDSTFSERLEFVGDAILDFMVIRYLYEREQQLAPGGLTLLKGAMVSNSALAAICVQSGLHKHFLHKSQPLQSSIRDYAAKLEASRIEEYQAAELDGRPPGQFWLELTAPKSLSDIVESIMGAVYLGDQFSTEGIEALFEKLLKPFYDKHVTFKTLSHHPTKLLFELFQGQGCRQFTIHNVAKEKKGALTVAQGWKKICHFSED